MTNSYIDYLNGWFVKIRAAPWQDLAEEALEQCKLAAAGIAPEVYSFSDSYIHSEVLYDYRELSESRSVSNKTGLELMRAVTVLNSLGIRQLDWHSGNVMVHRSKPLMLVDFGLVEQFSEPAEPEHLAQYKAAYELVCTKWRTKLSRAVAGALQNNDLAELLEL